jgi:hypothetical protein
LAQSLRTADDVQKVSLVLVLVFVAAVAGAMRRTAVVPLPDCILTIDAGVHLNLGQAADRRHLSDELGRIDLIASRFRERIRADPRRTHCGRMRLAPIACTSTAGRFFASSLRKRTRSAWRTCRRPLTPIVRSISVWISIPHVRGR